jgi:hypothetical protein
LAVLAVHFWPILEKVNGVRVNSKWRERLNKLLEEEDPLHNTTTTLRERVSEFSGNVRTLTAKTAKTQLEAEWLGLVAMWSIEFGRSRSIRRL